MHADVERFGHDPDQRFLRVIEQQGRVRLASDSNEQAAILLDYLCALATDVIGPFGTPAADDDNAARGEGFLVTLKGNRLAIAPGRFWVDGYLCVNDEAVSYDAQPDFPEAPPLPDAPYLVYLDAWERHLSAAQVPSIRDVALGGPDTCSRSKLVWQVRVAAVDGLKQPKNLDALFKLWPKWREEIDPPNQGLLAVDVAREAGPPDPCPAPADAGYYGNENQLYRVEIHRGSGVTVKDADLPATFKWSRDNGSVHYPLARIEGTVAVLLDPPLDCTKQLTPGTLVEVVDDHSELLGRPGLLARVKEVDDDGDDVVVHLSTGPEGAVAPERRPMLRRWDHPDVEGSGEPPRADGGLELVPGNEFVLEDGIVIRFGDEKSQFRTGDYWTFPARAATGDVIWPRNIDGKGLATPPHGVRHHLAPLAMVDDRGTLIDLRVGFPRQATLFS